MVEAEAVERRASWPTTPPGCQAPPARREKDRDRSHRRRTLASWPTGGGDHRPGATRVAILPSHRGGAIRALAAATARPHTPAVKKLPSASTTAGGALIVEAKAHATILGGFVGLLW